MRKTVLITGATRGIGRETAIKFAKNNYNIIITYKNSDTLANELKNIIENEYNVEVLTIKSDISKENEIKSLVQESLKRFKKIDVLVNNAAIANDSIIEDKTKETFNEIIDTNLIGPFLLIKEVSKQMLEDKEGTIINVSSTNGIDTYYPYSIDYDASKAGLISLTHNFAEYLAPYIRVNCVAPGWVNTDMNKNLDEEYIEKEQKKILLNRFAEPKEIANVIYFLTTEESKYINNTIIRVDGGIKNN